MNDGKEVEFPTCHEIVLKDHLKVISALAVDPSGARVVSGSHDMNALYSNERVRRELPTPG
ncbi:hypothetical protein M378DRAFT_156008, partial [Amanita muscaria Koide BX008]